MVSFLTYYLSPILDGHLLEVRDLSVLYAIVCLQPHKERGSWEVPDSYV